MKRKSGEHEEPATSSSKRRRADHPPVFDNLGLNRKISQLSADVKEGYVNCKISIKWPERLQAIPMDNSVSPLRFDIILGKHCVQLLEQQNVELVAGDQILLSLEGAEIERRTSTTKNSGIIIRFRRKLAFKWILCIADESFNGMICDTDKVDDVEMDTSEDITENSRWFQEPAESQPLQGSMVAHSNAHQERSSSDTMLESSPTPQGDNPVPQTLSKKERRKLERSIVRKRYKQQGNETSVVASSSNIARVPATSDGQQSDPTMIMEPPAAPESVISSASEIQVEGKISSGLEKALKDVEDAFASLSPGYLVVHDANAKMNHIMIGVVTRPGEPRTTRSGEYSRAFRIVDHSVCKESDGSLQHPKAFPVNCFSKHIDWLPQVEDGDVVVLCSLKMAKGEYQGIGYPDRLKWAVINSDTGVAKQPELSETSARADLGARVFPPFHVPTPQELAYCQSLIAWWSEVQNQVTEMQGTVHVVEDPNAETSLYTRTISDDGSQKRRHYLLAELTKDIQPYGYYDCTVEVLQLFDNGNHYALYVTDYSGKNELLPENSGPWAPPALVNSVMRVDLWDSARARAETIKVGQILHFRNIRIRENPYKEIESKMKENKISTLSHGELFDALLKRKKELRKAENPTIEYTLIENLVEKQSATVFVEVIHVKRSTHHTDMFVTDYSPHERLAHVVYPEADSWGHRLRGKVFKVKLADRQVILAENLGSGSFCTLQKMFVNSFPNDNNILQGRLSGPEELVFPHTGPQHMSPEAGQMYDALIKRRDNPNPQSNSKNEEPCMTKPSLDSVQPVDKKPVLPRSILPGQHLLTGRAVGIGPANIGHCCLKRCSACKEVIIASQRFKKCPHGPGYQIYQYRLVIKVQDTNGRIHPIDVADQWEGFTDLHRVNLNTSPKGVNGFLAAIQPLVGNWTDGSPCVNGPVKKWLVELKKTERRTMLCLVAAWDP